MSDSIELTTIGRCHDQILSTFRNNLEDIALFMRNEGIINKKIYHEVTDTTRLSDDDRAKILLRKWEDKVEEDTKSIIIKWSNILSRDLEFLKLS